MLNRWVRTVTSTVGRGGHRVGQIIKTLLRPVRTAAALTSVISNSDLAVGIAFGPDG